MLTHPNQVTHRSVLKLAVPMIISNITTPILGLVDTAVVGHLGDASYIGAVATGGLLFGFLYWGFGFLRMSTTGIAAQAVGRQNGEELRAILMRSMVIALLIAAILLVVKQHLAQFGFELLSASPAVENKASSYYFIRIWSAPFTLINYTLIGWYLGAQTAKAPLLITLAINLTNIVLDLVFVLHWNMGVEGVALASVIAEIIGVAVGLMLLPGVMRRYSGRLQWKTVFNAQKFKALIWLNIDVFIRTMCLIFAFAWFTNESAKQGDVILAANTVLLNFQTLMAYALDGIANAAEVLVGRAVGQVHRGLFWRSVYLCGLWSALVALIFTLLFAIFGSVLIASLTDLSSVQNTANQYLFWPVILPLISFWSFLFDGIFIGATWSASMRNCMLVATLLVFMPAWYWLQAYGNQGLWLAFTLFMVARAVTQGLVLWWNWRSGSVARF